MSIQILENYNRTLKAKLKVKKKWHLLFYQIYLLYQLYKNLNILLPCLASPAQSNLSCGLVFSPHHSIIAFIVSKVLIHILTR